MSVFVKDDENQFTSFNRSPIINEFGSNELNFKVEISCIESNADSLNLDFQYYPNTTGDILIGNLDILLLK